MVVTAPDQIALEARRDGVDRTRRRFQLLLIPGNPGLISYYAAFLRRLDLLLQRSDVCRAEAVDFDIVGRSLCGFEAARLPIDVKGPWDHQPTPALPPLGLGQQIDFVENLLRSIGSAGGEGERPSVILVGHSVGAFILLEILRHFGEARRETQSDVRVVGGICLFPTVVDIAKSQSGQKLGWILRLPYFALVASFLAKCIVFLLPELLLKGAVRLFTQFPEDAVSTTVAFLRSPGGVRQALHMARDEMIEITADRWDETIWGSSRTTSPKLFFYFGQSDHWVADRTRDDLIIERARKEDENCEWKPQMEVDKAGIPHGFCIRHSHPVARKCADYIEQLVLATKSRP